MRMKRYYLIQNLTYAHTFVVSHSWWHSLIGKPKLAFAECNAVCIETAEITFQKAGYQVGLQFYSEGLQ